MATKHNDSCLLKAEDNEPIFVLRAQDFSAPAIVRMWARMNRGNLSPAKYDEAMELASSMEQWPNRKFPD